MIERWRVRLPAGAPSGNNSRQVANTHCASVTKQYNLVPAKGRWCSAAGKVTVGLASHWPCITDFSGLSTYGLKGYEREMSTPPMLRRGMVDFTFSVPLTLFTATQERSAASNTNTFHQWLSSAWSRCDTYFVFSSNSFFSCSTDDLRPLLACCSACKASFILWSSASCSRSWSRWHATISMLQRQQ